MNFYRILTILNNSKGIYFSLQEDEKDSITAAGGGTNEYASTMSTHPQWEKSGSSELQNAYAQKCGRTSYAVGNISQIFPLSRKFARIVSDIFVSQAIVHMQNSAISKLDTSQNLTSFLLTKLPTRLIRPISPHL